MEAPVILIILSGIFFSLWLIAMSYKNILREKKPQADLSIIILAQDCEETAEGLFFCLSPIMQKLKGDGEVIVILRKSQDSSRQVLERICQRYNWVSLLAVEELGVSMSGGKTLIVEYLDEKTHVPALIESIEHKTLGKGV